MATTNSGHRYPPKFLYLEALVADRRTNSSTNDNTIDFDMINFNQENPISKTLLTSRKIPLKPHHKYCHQRSLPIIRKSMPINVPDWSRSDNDHVDDDDDDYDGDSWLPPHEYLARIRSASLSVHEGVGRTLKGRDLRIVRNAIWKQTGFEQD